MATENDPTTLDTTADAVLAVDVTEQAPAEKPKRRRATKKAAAPTVAPEAAAVPEAEPDAVAVPLVPDAVPVTDADPAGPDAGAPVNRATTLRQAPRKGFGGCWRRRPTPW